MDFQSIEEPSTGTVSTHPNATSSNFAQQSIPAHSMLSVPSTSKALHNNLNPIPSDSNAFGNPGSPVPSTSNTSNDFVGPVPQVKYQLLMSMQSSKAKSKDTTFNLSSIKLTSKVPRNYDIADYLLDLAPQNIIFDYLKMLRKIQDDIDVDPTKIPNINNSHEITDQYLMQVASEHMIHKSPNYQKTPFVHYSTIVKPARFINPMVPHDPNPAKLPLEYLKKRKPLTSKQYEVPMPQQQDFRLHHQQLMQAYDQLSHRQVYPPLVRQQPINPAPNQQINLASQQQFNPAPEQHINLASEQYINPAREEQQQANPRVRTAEAYHQQPYPSLLPQQQINSTHERFNPNLHARLGQVQNQQSFQPLFLQQPMNSAPGQQQQDNQNLQAHLSQLCRLYAKNNFVHNESQNLLAHDDNARQPSEDEIVSSGDEYSNSESSISNNQPDPALRKAIYVHQGIRFSSIMNTIDRHTEQLPISLNLYLTGGRPQRPIDLEVDEPEEPNLSEQSDSQSDPDDANDDFDL